MVTFFLGQRSLRLVHQSIVQTKMTIRKMKSLYQDRIELDEFAQMTQEEKLTSLDSSEAETTAGFSTGGSAAIIRPRKWAFALAFAMAAQ